ncbi:unnamed protein product [Allacma fusca]|uniref:Uncharacterized protein n=1 Tax=Allacma fusca TaxID=39272 RepID=A0A8J2NXN3_9HEXA|nr:unnamed protein product [Allacma fusca]
MTSKTIGILAVIVLLKMTAPSVHATVEEYGTTGFPQTSHELASHSLPELEWKSYEPTTTSASQNKDSLSSQSVLKRRRRRRKNSTVSKPGESMPVGNSTLIKKSDVDVGGVEFVKRHPLKPISDLIVYGMRRDVIQPRTGLLLFGAITAIEVVVGTTLLFGLSGMAIAALIAMIYVI